MKSTPQTSKQLGLYHVQNSTPDTADLFRKDEGSIHSSQFEVVSVSQDETGQSISPPHVHKRKQKNKARDLKQDDHEHSDPHDDHANLPRKSETSMGIFIKKFSKD